MGTGIPGTNELKVEAKQRCGRKTLEFKMLAKRDWMHNTNELKEDMRHRSGSMVL